MVKKCAEEETGPDKVFGKCRQKIEVYIKKGCRGFSPNRFYPKDPAIIWKYRLLKKLGEAVGRIGNQQDTPRRLWGYLFMDAGENKQRFISQMITGKSISRACDDIDEFSFFYADMFIPGLWKR